MTEDLEDFQVWEVVGASTLPTWVVKAYCAREKEPFTLHGSVYDGRLPKWVIVDYLVESM